MSAFNVIRKSQAVHLLTDAAVYTDDGVLTDIRSKVAVVPGMAAAITCRGQSGFLDLLTIYLGAEHPLAGLVEPFAFGSFDELAARFHEVLRAAVATATPAGAEPFSEFQAVLVGWSDERDCPEVYMAQGWPELMGNVPVNQVSEFVGDFIGAPDPDGLVDLPMPASVEEFDIGRHGLALVEAQRRTLGSNYALPGSPETYGVGGFVEHTMVTRDGVARQVLRTWPDRVGERIEPDREHLSQAG